MSLLDTIITKPKMMPPKGIWYGRPGVGKSTAGGAIPGALVLNCENGLGAIACEQTPYVSTWIEIKAWLSELQHNEHKYKALVIDTIDWLLRRMEEHVSGCAEKAENTLNKSQGGYGNGPQVLKNLIYQQLLPTLDRINRRGMAVIMLAHASRAEVTDADGVTIEKTAPDLGVHLNTLTEWSDFVCLVKREPDGSRIMVTDETPSAVAKNRYSLPEVVSLDWGEFCRHIAAGVKKTVTTKTTEEK